VNALDEEPHEQAAIALAPAPTPEPARRQAREPVPEVAEAAPVQVDARKSATREPSRKHPHPAHAEQAEHHDPPEQDRGVAEEVALMSRIRSAIQAGNSEQALLLLRQHEERFAKGVFADERQVSLAEALCAAGNIEKGKKVADAFVAQKPGSPLASRARRACSADETDSAEKRHGRNK
jgi:hypothetical protein